MTTIGFLLTLIAFVFSIWLIIIRRGSYRAFEIHADVASTKRVFLFPKRSRAAKWHDRLAKILNPIVDVLYLHTLRLRIFRIMVLVLGITPAWVAGIVLQVRGQDIFEALLLYSLGLLLVLLLRLEYLFSRIGYLETGGGGAGENEGSYIGYAKLPQKVYIGDSKNVSIELSPSLQLVDPDENVIEIGNREGDKLELRVKVPLDTKNDRSEYLETQLLAAGFDTQGDKDQRQRLNARKLVYLWNCYYPNSGHHTYAIRFRKTSDAATVDIGHIENATTVVKVLNLTQNQVYIVAAIFGIPSGVYLFVNAIKLLVEVLASLH